MFRRSPLRERASAPQRRSCKFFLFVRLFGADLQEKHHEQDADERRCV